MVFGSTDTCLEEGIVWKYVDGFGVAHIDLANARLGIAEIVAKLAWGHAMPTNQLATQASTRIALVARVTFIICKGHGIIIIS